MELIFSPQFYIHGKNHRMVVYSLSRFLKRVFSSTLCLIFSHYWHLFCSILSFLRLSFILCLYPSFCFFCPSTMCPSFHLSFNLFLFYIFSFLPCLHRVPILLSFLLFILLPFIVSFFGFFPQSSLMSPSQYVSRFLSCVFLLLSFFLSPKLSGSIFRAETSASKL